MCERQPRNELELDWRRENSESEELCLELRDGKETVGVDFVFAVVRWKCAQSRELVCHAFRAWKGRLCLSPQGARGVVQHCFLLDNGVSERDTIVCES